MMFGYDIMLQRSLSVTRSSGRWPQPRPRLDQSFMLRMALQAAGGVGTRSGADGLGG
jgi:hypothetical protein